MHGLFVFRSQTQWNYFYFFFFLNVCVCMFAIRNKLKIGWSKLAVCFQFFIWIIFFFR